MKSIAEFVSGGIADMLDLKAALQLAMQLEFATIPPYLCAQWSIKRDPDKVEGVIHRIVSEEMVHLGLAGNLLTAIGGVPRVATEDFVPNYPLDRLPGDIKQDLPIDLRPLDFRQLEVFMQIEYPHFPPIALARGTAPATIGDFYNTVIAGFQTVRPEIQTDAYAVSIFGAERIRDLATAIATLERIKSEGEGLEDSPEEPSSQYTVLAHYYAFKELYKQRRLVEKDGKWVFEGDSIVLPDVYQFTSEAPDSAAGFSQIFSRLLCDLEDCWTDGRALNVSRMFELKASGIDLVRSGIKPPFYWDDAACE